jgi:hypothetical protein
MRTVLAAAVAAASALLLVGCTPIVATGPTVTEERDIGAATTVVLETSGDLTIAKGEPALVIHAPEAALERLTSDVSGDTLRLGTTPGPSIVLGDVRYELTLPELEMIEVDGSGDVTAAVSAVGALRLSIDGSGDVVWTGLDSELAEISVAGSGDVEVDGTTGALTIELDGSGNIDAGDLEAREATVAIAGSGDVDVAVLDTLAAEISGSGRVTYSGDPSVEADITGSGEVVPR